MQERPCSRTKSLLSSQAGGIGLSTDLHHAIEELLQGTSGRISYAVEADGHRLSRAEEEVFPAASLIKVPILLTALELAVAGRLDLDQRIPLPDWSVGGAGLIEAFRPGSGLTLHDLLLCMIAISDNAATNLVLAQLGFEPVNALCARLGLAHTAIRRRMMDFDARRAGLENTTSAQDLHRLFKELVGPRRLDPTAAAAAWPYLERQQLVQGLGHFLPEGAFPHKTGELEGLFIDAGVLHRAGPSPVIMAFLADGVASVPEAQLLAARLGRLVYDATRGARR